ncbi:flagellar filament capping protein FliD [Xenorhabdus bovienii]|uniref:Flagellar hook-associated protein 2 n=1 Tax=Xenorhabdus bovienii TaxID=40576 RepID=A0AAJ1J9E7_XENBV|nr:flagellar filament capping protein FliD [Xenorhabdus bovienii]MDE1475302.1 flagellar filament capping protein FliD [Xenorhabdus bovienii]MDE1477633.1 flagellar filament capping protein FliD [Xenorhabdus bovienii]MDE1490572.1 flagellar filament capping protein FliD [Xenorhabdus bovienii]MDE1496258.1 flagellar filament capping protein FliD [Xenorhabdus bovienii]MDE9432730.1 flagellar filament capping protein FliD [Xenorhabdus bovienii]
MASISSLGAGSGMDLGSILDKLQAAERKRLEPLAQQQTSYKAKLTGFGTLKGSLEKLKSASEELKKFDKLNTTKVSEDHKTFTPTTDSKASPGNYIIEINQLAKAQSLQSPAVSDVKSPQGEKLGEGKTRTIVITQPGEEKTMSIMSIPLKDDETSLVEIRDAINKQEGNVNASIIKATDDKNHLILTSKKAGTKSIMTVEVQGDTKLNDLLNYTPDDKVGSGAMKQTVEAADAKLKVNGIEIERQTNEIKDAPEGITLNLKKLTEKDEAGNPKPETLVVSRDIEPTKEAIKKWVDAYNGVQTTFESLTKFKPVAKGESASKDNGALLGDGTLKSIQSQLRHQLFSPQDVADIATLNKLGIKQKLDGTLEISNEKLEKNLKEKPANVKAFFMGDGEKTGFATQTYNILKQTLDSHEGTIATATEGINKRLKTLERQVEQTNKNIDATIERYKRQFTELDKLVNSLKSTSSSLFQLLR